MTNQIDLILTPEKQYAVVRTGVVVSSTSSKVSVDVSDTVLEAGYLDWYTPAAGDRVALLLQDASWLCLGKFSV